MFESSSSVLLNNFSVEKNISNPAVYCDIMASLCTMAQQVHGQHSVVLSMFYEPSLVSISNELSIDGSIQSVLVRVQLCAHEQLKKGKFSFLLPSLVSSVRHLRISCLIAIFEKSSKMAFGQCN